MGLFGDQNVKKLLEALRTAFSDLSIGLSGTVPDDYWREKMTMSWAVVTPLVSSMSDQQVAETVQKVRKKDGYVFWLLVKDSSYPFDKLHLIQDEWMRTNDLDRIVEIHRR
ncbi:MAG TPA: hypothetical protein DEG43_07750 [Acidimicrobiaceae bacterium]|nr:hypothetical protein [Acidimicrobiaceae bacterium]